MKTELIESTDLNDEFERYYFSGESKNKINRRDFMKYCTIGTAGVIFPVMSLAVQANPLIWFIRVMIPILTLATSFLSSEMSSTGDIYLMNDTNVKVSGDLELTLLNNSNNNVFSSEKTNYIVPPNKVQKYRFTNGPSANINSDIEAYLSAKSRIDRRKSDPFLIKC